MKTATEPTLPTTSSPTPQATAAAAPPAVAQPLSLSDRFALVVATGFGSGYSPFASGTAGTLVAIPLFVAIAALHPALQVLTTLTFCVLAVHVGERAGRHFGESDDGRIVSDEIAGYFVTMLLVPATPMFALAGFFLFRFFDIVKPWPARYFDRQVHNGFGNVMDDLFAGLYGRACMAVIVWAWPMVQPYLPAMLR